ncbi:hypothetical protein [Bradyrhizobium japonicum]|jgi:hypothetical protein|uniref:hypothetical protein n=1 Tax=Bradyrhizobium japonicum TaxID=375 RepID=UPI0003F5607B|nr:hypothetical protein [Bradyrhizobium japonicum]
MIEVDGAASERLLQPKMPPGVLTEGAVVDVRLRNSCASFALMIAGLILVPTGVLASSTDCSKIKSTTVPVELVVRFVGFEQTYQIYRGAGKTAVLWTRQIAPNGINVAKADTINGFAVATSSTTNVEGVPDRDGQLSYSGISIEDYDHRNSVSFKVLWTFTYRNGTTRQAEQSFDHIFVSAGETVVGSCGLAVYRKAVKFTAGGQTKSLFLTYFPELRVAVTSPASEPAFISLSTSFEPIRMLR